MSFNLDDLIRPNIAALTPYSSARSDFEGEAEVFLDANENAFGSPAGDGFNRYPDPLQKDLKVRIAEIKGVDVANIFVGNGSDEAIDLLFRIFCEPGIDECIICPPTYGMYRVSAEINDTRIVEVPLTRDFQLNVDAIVDAVTHRTKLIFICSPNNPTGNLLKRTDIIRVAENFAGLVIVDEAYIDFAGEPSLLNDFSAVPNMVILQTFSKAWGMAGLRVGMAFADQRITDLMNRVKPPYNVSGIAQKAVIEAFNKETQIHKWIQDVRSERDRLRSILETMPIVEIIFPSEANFLLVKVADARELYRYLINERIVVRDRSSVALCEGCLRITVGTSEENDLLIDAIRKFGEAQAVDEVLPILIGGL